MTTLRPPERLGDLLAASVAARGGELAYVDEEQATTWVQFAALVDRMARGLVAQGVARGDRVAVFSGNRVEVVVAYFAVVAVGGVVVPINERLQGERVRELLADSGAVGLLTDRRLGPKVAAGSEWRWVFDDGVDAWPNGPTHAGPTVADGDDVALQMYTSGTTQKAKGVLLTHRHVLAKLEMFVPLVKVRPDTRYLQLTPLFHIGGFAMMMVAAKVGFTAYIASSFQPDLAARALEAHRITHTLMVPAMLRWLLLEPETRDCDLSALQLVLYGASPMPVPLLEEAMDRLQCGFVQGYGLTETTAILTALTVEDHVRARETGDLAVLASAGRPLDGITVRLVDADGRDVAAGQSGEIVARGPHITAGYHQRPEANATSFRDGWFHTGDLGRRDDQGYISVVGRLKDLVIVGGENVTPGEVEGVVASMDGVAEVAVVGAPDPALGEAVCAFVVPSPGVTLAERAVIAHCRRVLAPFQCPRLVRFVDQLPRNAAGKVLKAELRAPLWADAPRPV